MKKQEIFNNDIRWLASKKKLEEELDKIEEMIKLFRDQNACKMNRGIAASNISVYGESIRKLYNEIETIEEDLLNKFHYIHPDVVIEDDDRRIFY